MIIYGFSINCGLLGKQRLSFVIGFFLGVLFVCFGMYGILSHWIPLVLFVTNEVAYAQKEKVVEG